MKPLEDSLTNLLKKVTDKKKKLGYLDAMLLEKLNSVDGNLIDDDELVDILGKTKNESRDIQDQLIDAANKTREINETREQYRPVAIRGSVMYFCMIEIANIDWMYNSSLDQFLTLYDNSINIAPNRESERPIRVASITKVLTYEVFKYVNRGLFGKDKITYLLMICFKILITDRIITEKDVSLFLKAGELISQSQKKPKPNFDQLGDGDDIWKNINALSLHKFGNQNQAAFKDVADSFTQGSIDEWKAYYNSTSTENLHIPSEFAEIIANEKHLGEFMKFCFVRCTKPDKTIIAAKNFILNMFENDDRFIAPPPEETKILYELSSKNEPILFLLSAGADPTGAVDELATNVKKKINKISLGEGQEEKALAQIAAAIEPGNWILL